MLSRRTFLLGGGATGVVAAAGGIGVHQGVLPGRVWLQAHLGLNGEDGVVPDVAVGPVDSGEFVSTARLGATTRWHLLRPPGATSYDLPLVVALHGLGWEIDAVLPGDLGVPEFLAAAVADEVRPFAIVVPDDAGVRSSFEPGAHDRGFWRRVMPAQLEFLGARVGSSA